MLHQTSPIGRALRLVLINLLMGLCLFAFMYANEDMWWPVRLETPLRGLYNAVFGFTLPMQAVMELVRDRSGHHVPVAYRFVAALLTPLFITGLFSAFLWARRKQVDARAAQKKTAPETSKVTRRVFLLGASDAAIVGTGAIFSAYSTWYEPYAPVVRRYDVPIKGLPRALDGYTIAHISDTHYGPFVSIDQIRHAIKMANDLAPDFTVLTGDYVHRTRKAIDLGVGIFSEVRAKHGVAAVLGNHDHWEDAVACRKVFEQIGLPAIDGSRLFLNATGRVDSARPGEGICLAGIGDLWEDVVNIGQTLRGVDPEVPRILLSHNPDVAEDRSHQERIDLMLSGHTHGGQISVPYRGTIIVPSAFGQRYAGGWCEGPTHPVIVSRGVGLAVMPYRFRVRPEIVHITLHETRA